MLKQETQRKRRMCGDKVPYLSRIEAVWAISEMRAANPEMGPAKVYRCPYCGFIHWGRK